MKNIVSYLLIVCISAFMFTDNAQAAQKQTYKPFILASTIADSGYAQVLSQTRAKLESAGFEVLGEYSPYQDTFVKNATVIIVTNADLKAIAKESSNGGFAAPWRISVTETKQGIQISYMNPVYLKHAYRLKGDMTSVSNALESALGKGVSFGSKKGLTAKKLNKYRYMMGMEKFQHVYQLATHDSHAKAIEVLEKKLASNKHGLGKVYRLDLDENTSVFGVSRKGPTEAYRFVDDEFIMQIVDFQEHKGTAYLPYEIMVKGNEIIALHMRFRMAVHYPDLKMMGKHSFMKIKPSPKEIAWAFGEVSK